MKESRTEERPAKPPASEVVEPVQVWPRLISAGGMEIVDGREVSEDGQVLEGQYLVWLPGEYVNVILPDDLWQHFARIESPAAALKFATKWGSLDAASHFHRSANMQSAEGDRVSLWLREAAHFRAVMELWYDSHDLSEERLRRQLALVMGLSEFSVEQLSEGNILQRASKRIADEPARLVRAAVVRIINIKLGRRNLLGRACGVHGCEEGPEAPRFGDTTHCWIRTSRNGDFDLCITPESLLKTLWLQLASVVVGNKVTVRCQAPDCPFGGRIDVTDKQRKAAWKMHPECRDRLKKQKKRRG